MIKCIILDLDGTLINTTALDGLRDLGRWRDIEGALPLCSPHEAVVDVLNTARSAGLKIAIFTNSPSSYAQRLLRHFEISTDYLVAYHDVRRRKPDSEGVQIILDRFRIGAHEAVYLGNSNEDFLAARAANVEYFSVDWSESVGVPEKNFGVAKLLEFIGAHTHDAQATTTRSSLIQSANHFYLGYYLAGIKQEVWAFKDGQTAAVERWLNKVRELSVALPKVDYVVRALGHAETRCDTVSLKKPLDHLAKQVADALKAVYQPDLLLKNRVLVKSTQCSAKERELQVNGAYAVNSGVIRPDAGKPLTFLIVDDVFTSGATANEIRRALGQVYPTARTYIFTLVKTLYRAQAGENMAEAQHNSQLFSDLYVPLHAGTVVEGRAAEPRSTKSARGSLITKRMSANYSETNHNFVFQNLKSYSISSEPGSETLISAIYVLKNMLQRGKPTVASRKLRNAVHVENYSECEARPQALISKRPVEWKRLIRGDVQSGRFPAKRFFDELIPKYLGEYAFVKQLMLPEVQIFDMTQVYVERFNNRQVDFYIPQAGLIIEIDGAQHLRTTEADSSRDEFTCSLGLKTVRITTEEIYSENESFVKKMGAVIEHIRLVDHLEREGIMVPPNGLRLQNYKEAFDEGINTDRPSVRLTAAIRFQLLLLELIESGDIRLGQQARVHLINRDGIDFAKQAVDDLAEHLQELFVLMGVGDLALDVEVVEIKDGQRHPHDSPIVVDFSVLERFDDRFQSEQHIIFARTHYFDFYRKFTVGDANSLQNYALVDYDFFEISCAKPVTYDLDLSPDSRQRAALRFFLANLFLPAIDDADFREGQAGIIGSALARKGTIGLLPTGSGKSICYQLAAVLQPSISFVVCPIKSLMYDQKADLDAIGFTRSNFITSDLKPDQKAKVQNDYGRGKYFFVFISPERFQTHKFRAEMAAIGLDRSFAYAVIDEAHCLSEWGHDFRTSYLNLSNTISRLAPNASYIGLTATASVNVLQDIQTEFGVLDENVRTPIEFTREELIFHVIDDLGKKGQAALALVKSMEAKWCADGSPMAGIVFTPTVNGPKGCYELAGQISSSLDMEVNFYSGTAPKNYRMSGDAFDAYKQKIQQNFKANNFRLMTATKAFGMGVNKGNIAYTIHFGIPGSMEALYQEAGRAGRDKKLFRERPADCFVLLSREKNATELDRIWSTSINVNDLKDTVSKLSRDSDVNTNLWLMTNNLDTINDEFKLMSAIYGYLEANRDSQKLVLAASDFGADKFKFERANYRLSQLGIVNDWVVEDFFKGVLSVEFTCLDEEQLIRNIENTIRKYDSKFNFSDLRLSTKDTHVVLNDRLARGVISRTQHVFLVLLVWSYDHFFKNRKQSLKNVYERCSELASGKISESKFKFLLEGYFKNNNTSQRLKILAEDSVDTQKWLSVFFDDDEPGGELKIISDDKLITLKAQLSRFLESYHDNAFLNFISGLIRLVHNEFDDADGARRMLMSLDRLAGRPMVEIEWLMRDTVRLKPLLSTESQCRLARLVHEKFQHQNILEILNTGFQDPYTYGVLLDPLLLRIKRVTDTYKGLAL